MAGKGELWQTKEDILYFQEICIIVLDGQSIFCSHILFHLGKRLS